MHKTSGFEAVLCRKRTWPEGQIYNNIILFYRQWQQQQSCSPCSRTWQIEKRISKETQQKIIRDTKMFLFSFFFLFCVRYLSECIGSRWQSLYPLTCPLSCCGSHAEQSAALCPRIKSRDQQFAHPCCLYSAFFRMLLLRPPQPPPQQVITQKMLFGNIWR